MKSRNLWATHIEIIELVKATGLTRQEICTFLDVTPGTLQNWMACRSKAPRPVVILLSLLENNEALAAYARAVARGDEVRVLIEESDREKGQTDFFDPRPLQSAPCV